MNAKRSNDQLHRNEIEALVADAPFGVCVLDATLRLRTANRLVKSALQEAGALVGRDIGEILCAIGPEPQARAAVAGMQHVLETGAPGVFITRAGPLTGYEWRLQRLAIGEGTFGVACYLNDVTLARDAEIAVRDRRLANAEFLTSVQDQVADFAAAADIMRGVGERLGEYLRIAACHFCEIDDLHDAVTVEDGWRVPRVPAVAGRFRISEYLGEELRVECRAGATVAVADTQADPRTGARPFAALGIHAFVVVPFIRDGEWKYVLAVTDDRRRDWTDEEMALFRDLSNRVFPRLERARAEAAVARDLRDTRLLRDLSTKLATDVEMPALYQDILEAAIALTGADAGTVQILDEGRQELALLATKGFSKRMTDHFEWVGATSDTSCGIALATNTRTFVEFDDPALAHLEHMRLHVDAGYRSAQSTPLVTRGGRPIGMVSTHWHATRHRPDERQLRFLDLLVRQTADLLERRRADVVLRASQSQLEAELADTKRLQELSAALVHEHEAPASLFDTILDTAAALMGSQFASMQLLDSSRGHGPELRLLAARGFAPDALEGWDWVTPTSRTSCGEALRTGVRIVVRDVEADDAPGEVREHDASYRRNGIRAMQTTPLINRAGRILGMISTHWRHPHQPSERSLRLLDILARQAADFIERTQAEDALRRSQVDLQEADRRKDEFLAVLAHELRNPLAPIRTGLDLIRAMGDSPDAVRQVREMLQRQVGHMVRLIDDLMEVSRITSGTIRLQRVVAPLADLVNTAIETHRAALEAARIRLTVDLPAEPVWLDVDPTRLVQVLSNILHNAVKFTGADGCVTIAARVTRVHGTTGPVEIAIADSGAGIAPDMLGRVFDLFTQDKASATRPQPGLGIGLALSRRLVEMHGGSIDAHSDGPGRGSTFTIRLLASTAEPAAKADRPLNGLRLARRVLVVDDNEDAANAMAILVDVLGGESRVAFDGESGVREALDFCPDIVLLDIGMPGMNGYEACRRIRAERGRDLTLVALTGWGHDRDRAEAMQAGFDAHLTKPTDLDALRRLFEGFGLAAQRT
jgi:signal transduction histidine kinase